MTTLTLQIDNNSLLDQLKNILKAMKGIRIIDTVSSEDEVPNAITLAAMKEAESGNDAGTVDTSSLEAFDKSME